MSNWINNPFTCATAERSQRFSLDWFHIPSVRFEIINYVGMVSTTIVVDGGWIMESQFQTRVDQSILHHKLDPQSSFSRQHRTSTKRNSEMKIETDWCMNSLDPTITERIEFLLWQFSWMPSLHRSEAVVAPRIGGRDKQWRPEINPGHGQARRDPTSQRKQTNKQTCTRVRRDNNERQTSTVEMWVESKRTIFFNIDTSNDSIASWFP